MTERPEDAGSQQPVVAIRSPRRLLVESLAHELAQHAPEFLVTDFNAMDRGQSAPAVCILEVGEQPVEAAAKRGLIDEVHHGAPDARILVLSGCRADPEVIQWIAKGAHGYFTTNLSLPLLVAAVRMLAAGGVFLPPELSWRLLEGMPRQNVPA